MSQRKITLEQTFIKNKRKLAWRDIDGELIVLYIPEDNIYKVNSIGWYIWNLLDGKKKLNEVVESVCAEFNVSSKSEVEKDTISFVEDLIKYDIVKTA